METISPTVMLQQCEVALTDEITAIRSKGSAPITLTDGAHDGIYDGHHLYGFTADVELIVPDDAPAELEIGRLKYKVTIVAITGFTVLLQVRESLGPKIPSAKLHTDPSFLLGELRERLSELRRGMPILGPVAKLLSSTEQPSDSQLTADLSGNSDLAVNRYQQQAITHVLNNEVAFVWGPPGTGKTTTLGHAVAALARKGESVLVVTHSNTAVDAAALSVGKLMQDTEEYIVGRVLRVGVTRTPEMADHRAMQPREVVRRDHPDLIREIEGCERTRDQLVQQLHPSSATNDTARRNAKAALQVSRSNLEEQLEEIKEQLRELYQELKAWERRLTAEARIVLCTLSKAAIAEELYSRKFDAVIIDEASMTYIPADLHAASLAKRRVAVFGDFRQLPPITQGDSPAIQEWLEPDVFEKAGIVRAVDLGRSNPRLTMLEEQYRMHPDIADIIKNSFYNGRLKTAEGVAERCLSLLRLPPGRDSAVALLDIGRLQPFAFKEGGQNAYWLRHFQGNSRFNPFSALISVELARAACRDGDAALTIGIITPYAAQARLINKLLRDMQIPRDKVICSTVHRFQGSERDTIIYDVVEGKPSAKVGWLISSTNGSVEGRLLNVALSRAKGKLVILADLSHLDEVLPENNVYTRVLRSIRKSTEPVVVRPGKRAGIGLWGYEAPPGITYYPGDAVSQRLIREKVAVDLKGAEMVSTVTPTTSVSGSRSHSVHLSSVARQQVSEFTQLYERTWEGRGLGLSVVGIDQRVLWIDNVEYAIRVELPHTVKLLYGWWKLLPDELRHIKSTEQMRELTRQGQSPLGRACPDCGQPLWPRIEYGKAYMACSTWPQCGYRVSVSTKLATEWAHLNNVHCPECGSQLVGTYGNWGIYLRCIKHPSCKGNRRFNDFV